MATFGATLKDNNILDVVATGSTITINDHSNYDTNTDIGHTQADFDAYRKIVFLNPNNTTYTFSSVGGGNENLSVPSAVTVPIETVYTYSTGDGVYGVTLYTVPTWDNAAPYTIGMCVYLNGNLYIAIDTSTNVPPPNTSKWTLIPYTDLPTKYRYTDKFAVYCQAIECFQEYVKRVICGFSALNCTEDLCSNPSYLKASKIQMALNAIPALVDAGDWDSVADLLNFTNQLCCCNG